MNFWRMALNVRKRMGCSSLKHLQRQQIILISCLRYSWSYFVILYFFCYDLLVLVEYITCILRKYPALKRMLVRYLYFQEETMLRKGFIFTKLVWTVLFYAPYFWFLKCLSIFWFGGEFPTCAKWSWWWNPEITIHFLF